MTASITEIKCDICKNERSVRVKGAWVPCECLEKVKLNTELLKAHIATVTAPVYLNIKDDPDWFEKTLYIRSKDVPQVLMPVLSGIFLKAVKKNAYNHCWMVQAFGLVTTYLGRDSKHQFIDDYCSYSHLAIMLNFGDAAPNRLLNSLVRHVYEGRVLRQKPTYIISDVPKHELPDIYTADKKLFEYISGMPEIDLDKYFKPGQETASE